MSSRPSNRVFRLNTGADMPAVGLGTYKSTHEVAVQVVKNATECGYRHIDTAWSYGNEESIGQGIRESGIPRHELFVTDKLWQTWHTRAEEALANSLAALGIEYLDLWLLHWPVSLNPNGNHAVYPRLQDGSADVQADWDFVRTWKAMEDIFLRQNATSPPNARVKAIGVSNCSTVNLQKILDVCRVVPAVNQVELHPFCAQPKLADFCREKGIQLAAYSPLGGSGNAENAFILTDSRIQTLSERALLSPAQLILSWGVQKGWAVLPKSSSPDRIKANLDIYILEEGIMEEIDALGMKEKHRTCRPYWADDIFHDDC